MLEPLSVIKFDIIYFWNIEFLKETLSDIEIHGFPSQNNIIKIHVFLVMKRNAKKVAGL